MRKIILFFVIFVLICFFIPVIFTRRFEIMQVSIDEEILTQEKDEIKVDVSYNYNDFSKIRLLHVSTGEVEEVNLDEYLCNVVSAEIPAYYSKEALKAQAIVARTYTIYNLSRGSGKHEGADLCDSSGCCQAWISKNDRFAKWDDGVEVEYWNNIVEAVNSTIGEVITYDGEVINALYHANSGGKTEIASMVWGGGDYPYLQSVETVGEDEYSQYSSEAVYTYGEIESKIKNNYPDFCFDENRTLEILEYTDSNRVKTVKIGDIEIAGTEMRSLLGLRSTNFTIVKDGENIRFQVIGFGHGVGMSQTGADSLGKQGMTYEEIIKHYYTNVEIININ